MKKSLGFVLMTLTVSFSAMAASQPWQKMVGKYSLSETCTIAYRDGFTKAELSLSVDGKKLKLTAYKGAEAETQMIPISKFQTPAHSTDGDVYSDVQRVTENSFVSTEHFVRKGSDTWPDLEMLEAYYLSLENGKLTYKVSHQDTYAKNKTPKVTTCVLTALSKGSAGVTSVKISTFNDSDLAKIARAFDNAVSAHMNLDQAALLGAQLRLNKVNLTNDEVIEVLALYANMENTNIELESADGEPPARTAEKALIPSLGIPDAELQTSEYKPLIKLRDTVAEVLAKKKANLKVTKVRWSASDADGEGLLIIDQTTGEALYIGSGYFS